MKAFIFLFPFIIAVSCNDAKTTEASEIKPKPKVEYNYSFGKLYRDSINKFRLQYPSNWEIVSGEAKHTVIKFINRDSSMSLSVNVMYDDGSMTYYKLSETELNDFKSKLTTALTSAGKPPIDMTLDNAFLDNRNAVITSYKSLFQQIDVQLLFQFYSIKTLMDGKIYNITLIVPDEYFTESFKSYINNFLYSFRFYPE